MTNLLGRIYDFAAGEVTADVNNESTTTDQANTTNPYQRDSKELFDWKLLDTFLDGDRTTVFDYTYNDTMFDLMRVVGVVALDSVNDDIKFRVGGDSGANYDYVVRNGTTFTSTASANEWITEANFSRVGVFDYIFMDSPTSEISSGSSSENVVMYGRSIHGSLARDDLVQGTNENANLTSINVFTDGDNDMRASIKVFGFDFADWVVA